MSIASIAKSRGRAKGSRSLKVDDSIFDSNSVVYENAAGIDIGSEAHYVSVPEDRAEPSVRTFGCFTTDIGQAAYEKQNEARTRKGLISRAASLGYGIVSHETGAILTTTPS